MKSNSWILLLLAAALSARADVRLAALFKNHAVLQRDKPLPVWGWAEPGEKVTVQFGGQSAEATANMDGKWAVKLAPMKANSTAQELVVTGKNTLRLRDVLVGDVWLCSGQSNMDFRLGGCRSPQDIETADFSGIRFLTLPIICAEKPKENVETREPWFRWRVCSPATAGGVSGVGFYFARRIHRETGVPIGLLVSSVGGTNIEKWMPKEAFDEEPALAGMARDIDRAIAEYRRDVSHSLRSLEAWIPQARDALQDGKSIPEGPEVPKHPSMPGSRAGGHWLHLYNGMIAPLVAFPVRGAIWYQGENHSEEQESYVAKMDAMIGHWRKQWGYEFPFYYAQLANWLKPTDVPSGEDKQWRWQKCRMAQLKALKIPKTGMAVIIDIGDADDIHPRNKFDVGERLALWALAKDYGKTDLVYSGPLYKGMKVEGNKIRLTFDSVGSGLMAGEKNGTEPTREVKGGKLKRFALAGEDKKWVWADAVIDGQTVVVSSPDVPNPVAVRYAYSINPEGCNLYNKEGLPASPFRTDNW
jgi:sialate O-acetylesterase